MKKIVIAGLLSLTLALPTQVNAWGLTGHRIVGEVADRHLTPKARAAIKKILGFESIAMASNWADFVKSDTSYKYLDSWHYVNIPSGLDRQGFDAFLVSEKNISNIHNKTLEMMDILRDSKSTVSQKQMAMRLLIHFVGDLHQPMHTGRKEDLGGNRVTVSWFNDKTNLHSLWDSKLIDFQQLSYTEYATAVNHASPIELVKLKQSTLEDAIYDSYLASNHIYANTVANTNLSFNYNFKYLELLNTQLRNGGIRLAAMLNNLYAK